jgi:EAL domain-containing protein (putative c-di-GMP-specific phosphodiesterase class I)
VLAYEALLRTTEPTLRNPLDFISAAEKLNMTRELGRIIRRHIADLIPSAPASALAFVNLHPADLDDPELSDPAGPLSRFADRIVLEVTERAALDEIPGLAGRIARLRGLGFRIAVDDLGAGYAGLSTFASLEPDVVKADMSLIRDIHKSAVKQKVVGSIVALCQDLRIQFIAEGIETAPERDCVTSLGGDNLQGYLFARPNSGFPAPAY